MRPKKVNRWEYWDSAEKISGAGKFEIGEMITPPGTYCIRKRSFGRESRVGNTPIPKGRGGYKETMEGRMEEGKESRQREWSG